jgi:hypothetical protein
MSDVMVTADRLASLILWASAALALATLVIVVLERAAFGLAGSARLRFQHHYRPLIQRALAGDDDARRQLVDSPARHRVALARLLIEPLIADRNPERIVETRAVAEAIGRSYLLHRASAVL